MPIKLTRRGHGGPSELTEITAMKFAGIDYHKRYSVVCIIDETGGSWPRSKWSTPFPSASDGSSG